MFNELKRRMSDIRLHGKSVGAILQSPKILIFQDEDPRIGNLEDPEDVAVMLLATILKPPADLLAAMIAANNNMLEMPNVQVDVVTNFGSKKEGTVTTVPSEEELVKDIKELARYYLTVLEKWSFLEKEEQEKVPRKVKKEKVIPETILNRFRK